MDDKGIVTLMRFASAGEANIYKALLDANGVTSMLTGEYVNEIYPIGDSWAGIELQVAPEDEGRAREILAAGFDKEEFQEDTK